VCKVVVSMAAVVVALASSLASSLASGSEALSDVKLSDVQWKVVNYSDLNLSSPAGAVTLYKRISHAAHVVCYLPLQSNDETGARHRACVNAAMKRGVNEVNAPELTRYYESRLRKVPTFVLARDK
jgi:UrcA family protein